MSRIVDHEVVCKAHRTMSTPPVVAKHTNWQKSERFRAQLHVRYFENAFWSRLKKHAGGRLRKFVIEAIVEKLDREEKV
jgi:hypothetical protein